MSTGSARRGLPVVLLALLEASAGGLLFVVGGPNGLAESTLLRDPERVRWAVAPGPAVPRQRLGVTAWE